jgi:hypothetical protein
MPSQLENSVSLLDAHKTHAMTDPVDDVEENRSRKQMRAQAAFKRGTRAPR